MKVNDHAMHLDSRPGENILDTVAGKAITKTFARTPSCINNALRSFDRKDPGI
jgi:hypothetical protein